MLEKKKRLKSHKGETVQIRGNFASVLSSIDSLMAGTSLSSLKGIPNLQNRLSSIILVTTYGKTAKKTLRNNIL